MTNDTRRQLHNAQRSLARLESDLIILAMRDDLNPVPFDHVAQALAKVQSAVWHLSRVKD